MLLLLIFFTLTLLLAIFTLLPLWRYEVWWVRGFDFPRMQLLLFSVLLLIVGVVLLDFSEPTAWSLLVVNLACFIFQAWWITPYTRLFPVEVHSAKHPDEHNTITILTANVLTPNRNSAGFIELVMDSKPDVVVTLETDEWWQSKLDTLEADYRYAIKCPQDNLYGMHVYSKFPLSESRVEYLVEHDVPSIHTLIRLPSGRTIQVHFLHPAPPSPVENETSVERDAELVAVAKSVAESDLPVIVTGDLNDVAWSATTRLFRKISGLLDPRIGRGMYNTFHAGYWFLRWPLDHLFHSDHFTLCSIQRLPSFGSDHFALLTKLADESSKSIEQEGLDADVTDHLWAGEKLDNIDVNSTLTPK